jgi:adiponectin receptor
MVSSYRKPYQASTDHLFFSIFYVGAVVCLGASAAFHCFLIHSERVHEYLHRLDHFASPSQKSDFPLMAAKGIVVLIVASVYPAIYYGFYCDALARNAYLVLLSSFGCLTAYTIFASRFRTKEARRIRAWLYIVLGLSAVLPIGHCILRDGVRVPAPSPASLMHVDSSKRPTRILPYLTSPSKGFSTCPVPYSS